MRGWGRGIGKKLTEYEYDKSYEGIQNKIESLEEENISEGDGEDFIPGVSLENRFQRGGGFGEVTRQKGTKKIRL